MARAFDVAQSGNPRFVGVLMLDTRFPRLPGDIGHPSTFERAGIPARFVLVAGATPQRVVREADASLIGAFVDAARALEAQGAALITTSCGFLAAHQRELEAAVAVPVIASSLLQCRRFERVGIVTIDARSLTAEVLRGAGVADATPVRGVDPQGEFAQRILGNDDVLEHARGGVEVVQAVQALVARHPWIEHVVLECTNMPPHREAVVRATGRRVHDIETLVVDAWRSIEGVSKARGG